MIEKVKFDPNNPKNDYEKLVIEYVNTLDEATQVFVNLNKETCDADKVLNSILSGSVYFVTRSIKLLAEKSSNSNDLIEESVETFMRYIKDMK